MKRTLFMVIVASIVVCEVRSTDEVSPSPLTQSLISDEDTALLMHFDDGLNADPAGTPVAGSESGVELILGKFGKSAKITTNNSNSPLAYKLSSPWTTNEGTISVWVKLDWDAKSNIVSGRHILDIFTGEEKKNRIKFYIYSNGDKSPGSFLFLHFMDADGKTITHGIDLANDAKWHSGEWHHIAVSWASGKGIIFSADGITQKLGKAGETWKIDLSNATVLLGAPYYTTMWQKQGKEIKWLDGALDELMISRKPLLPL